MKIKKTIKIIATTKEMETIGNCIALFEEMEEDIWEELNNISSYRLDAMLSALQELHDNLEEEEDD